MTDATCQCGEPTDAALCHRCGRTLRRMLGDLPALAQDLTVTLTRQDRVTPGSDGGRSANIPLPLNLAASDVLGQIRATLVGWCRVIAEDWHIPLPSDTITAMSAWLASQKLRLHEAAADMYGEIRDLHRRGRDVIQPRDRARFEVGPCPVVLDPDTNQPSSSGAGDPCPGRVIATIPHDEQVPPSMDCPACGSSWDTRQWLRAGERIDQRSRTVARQQQTAEAISGKRRVTIRCPECGADRDGRHCACGATLLMPGESLPPRPEGDEPWRVYRWHGTWVHEPMPEQPSYPFGYVSVKAWEARQDAMMGRNA